MKTFLMPAAASVARLDDPAAGRSLIVRDACSPDLIGLQSAARLPLAPINPGDDPLSAVAALLRSRSLAGRPVEVLHLVGHGRPGAIRLSGQWLDATTLRAAAAVLSGWSVPRIVLWSCQAGLDGDFIAILSELSGASVLASKEVLGHGTTQSIDGSDGEVHHLTDLFDRLALAEWAGQLSFSTATETITLSGSGLDFSNGIRLTTTSILDPNPLGTLFLYKNAYVDPSTGQSLDVLIGIQELTNAVVNTVDSDSLQFAEPSYFQPNVTITKSLGTVGGSAKFHFQFIQGGSYTGPEDGSLSTSSVSIVNVQPGYDELRIDGSTPYTKVNVLNLNFTAFDIDGQSGNPTARQFIETTAYDPNSVTLGNTSELAYSEVLAPDGGTSLRIEALNTGDSNPNSGSAGFDADDFLAHQATVNIGAADNFDLIVGDASNTTSTYLALFGISFNVPTAELGDFVFEDLNANGIQDPGESGIADITVNLLNSQGNIVQTQSTNESGFYLFSDIAAGMYSVQFVTPEGYVATAANQGSDDNLDSDADPITGFTDMVALTSGSSNTSLDAGFYQLASLGDFVWSDTNANGIQDDGEAGIADVTVNLLDASGNTLTTTTTNSSGAYSFSGLTPGSYGVQFVAPSGFLFSAAAQGGNDALDSDANPSDGKTDTVTLTSGQNNTSLDAGLVLEDPADPPSLTAPGVRTPGFWRNWAGFWDGNALTRPNQTGTSGFPTGDLLLAPYTNPTVVDPVTGVNAASPGLLIGDFNRNGLTDSGEDTIFYTVSEASILIDSSRHPSGDARYTLGRSLAASWLNYLAGNPVDTAAANDKDARFYIREGVNWLQALTPDENGDSKGDGALNGLVPGVSSPKIAASSTFWKNNFTAATSRPTPYNTNTNVSFLGGMDSGNSIHRALDDYNNGLGFADGVFHGG
jgi:hypothetical protein